MLIGGFLFTLVRVEVTAAELRWRGLVRADAILLDQVTAVRWEMYGSRRESPAWRVCIEINGRKTLRFAGSPLMVDFTDELKTAAPHIKVRFPPAIAWSRAGYRGPFRNSWL
jgi:hypothetical protein